MLRGGRKERDFSLLKMSLMKEEKKKKFPFFPVRYFGFFSAACILTMLM